MDVKKDVRGGRKFSLTQQTLYISAACFFGAMALSALVPENATANEKMLGHLATILSVSVAMFHGANGLEGTFGGKTRSQVTQSTTTEVVAEELK